MECPESIEELKELEKLIPLCKVTLYEQAQARLKKNPEKSERQIAKEMAEELDKDPGVIRTTIQRGAKEVATMLPEAVKLKELNLTKDDKNIILKKASELRKEQKKERDEIEATIKKEIISQPLPITKYQTIVIDPPWPVKKIIRDERPNQGAFDYPTMSIEEIVKLKISVLASDNCHIYLWTTHKFLPVAFLILEEWGFKYQCLLTWVKNVGMTPFSWMYSTEHCLFGRKGSLDLLKLGERLDFNGKVREHSRKPEIFYELIKRVSPGPRIDIFSREKREGFDQFGNESDRF
uniref:Putative methyltransferase n=1 Tax=viral metagenome TaxID=1070528 RepID=A0A6M3JJM5_9ZZZZ